MTTSKTLMATGGLALALAFALVGCAPAAPTTSGSAGAIGTWGTDAAGEPQLVLVEDGSLSGTDGCNRLMGTWIEEGPTIVFQQVASTMMACDGVDTWLIDLDTAEIMGSTMHVMDADGVEIGTLARG